MHCTDKYSQHSSIIFQVWLNGRVLVYELGDCGFKSSCSHLSNYLDKENFKYILTLTINVSKIFEKIIYH